MASHDHRSRLATQGGVYTSPPDGFKPKGTGHVKTRKVECPDCHAPAGEWCRNLTTGEPTRSSHSSRKRMAIRAGLVEPPRTRPTAPRAGKTPVTCPVCDGTTHEIKARYASPEAKSGERIVAQHRVGGGRVSAVKGDIECRGSGRPLKVLLAEATPTD